MKKILFALMAMVFLLLFAVGALAEELPETPSDPYLKQINQTMRLPGLMRAKAATRFNTVIELENDVGYDEPMRWSVSTTGGTAPYRYTYIIGSRPPSGNVWISEGATVDTKATEFSYQFVVPNDYVLFVTVTDYDGYSETVYTQIYTLPSDEEHPPIETYASVIAQACMQEAMGDFDRAVWLHDYLTMNARFDETYSFYGPDGVLLRGTGVCDSYRKAYVMLLRMVGIDAGGVTGSTAGGNHAWVIAKLDGEWYMIDPTWDDPVTGSGSAVSGRENHLYFGMTDEMIAQDRVAQDYEAGYKHACTAHKDNYAFRTGQAREWMQDALHGKKSVAEQLTEQLDKGGLHFELTPVSVRIYGDNGYYVVNENRKVWLPVAWTMCEEDWKVGEVHTPMYVEYDMNRYVLNAELELGQMKTIFLPESLLKVEDEALRGGSKTGYVVVPEGTQVLGSKAFADCETLMCVQIPESVTSIAPDCFSGSTRVTLLCEEGSYAESWAEENHMKYETYEPVG